MIQHTDAFILMQFRDATKHLKGCQRTPMMLHEMKKHGQPCVDKLKHNGHTLADAVQLMKAVFNS